MLIADTPPAAESCAPFAQVRQGLADKYGETPFSMGVVAADDGGGIFLITRNAETGTWTAIIVRENGNACGVAAGSHWREPKPAPVGKVS